MEQHLHSCRPLLRTKKFSTQHIEIFELILAGKTNKSINAQFGYSERSHSVADHARKVMYKLLVQESLSKRDHIEQVAYPRKYCFWWKKVLEKHRPTLMNQAIKPEYYNDDQKSDNRC